MANDSAANDPSSIVKGGGKRMLGGAAKGRRGINFPAEREEERKKERKKRERKEEERRIPHPFRRF